MVLTVLLFFSATAVRAQTALSGGVSGKARDPRRAAVVGAEIVVRNPYTQETAVTRTGSDGSFRIVGLRPGVYTLTATSRGFAAFRRQRVEIEVGRITAIEVKFSVAAARESVEVREQAPTVNLTQPDFSSNISEAEIEKLPMDDRRWSNFALLTPGATYDDDYGLISFRGISGLGNKSTVDGANNNQAFFSEERGRTRISYAISPAAVREFQVNTSNYSAQYGGASGAVINTVTRHGGNHVHGTAFYYIRDNAWGAASPFTVVPVERSAGQWSTEAIKPLDRRQQFGASIGGPLLKNKLFYFANFDIQRRDFPGVATARDPSTLFSLPCVIPSHYGAMNPIDQAQVRVCGTDNSTSADELYTLTRNVMPYYTSDATAIAAFQGGLRYLASLLGPVPRTASHQIGLVKLDYRVTPRNNISLFYNRLRWSSPGGMQTHSAAYRGRASFGNDGVKVDTVTARLTSALNSAMVNELRYSWSRDFDYDTPQAPAPGEPVGPNGFAPAIAVNAYSSGFTFGTPASLPRRALPDEYRNEVADTLSWSHRHHLIKFGFDANWVLDQINRLYASGGKFHYSHRANFIADLCQWPGSPIAAYCAAGQLGYPTQYHGYSSYIQGYGPSAYQFRTFDGAFFAQDDWRALPRLTLSLGLRYDFELLPGAQAPNPLLAGSGSLPSDMNNFGPRIGFALDLTGDGKTSLRGGYGIYYGRISNSLISAALVNTGAQDAQRSYSFKGCYLFATDCLEGPLFPNTIPTDPYSSASEGNVTVFAPHMQVPQIHHADLILERRVSHNTVLSASYLLSLGRELPNFVDLNLDPASVRNIEYLFAPDYYTGEPGPYNGDAIVVPVITQRLDPNFQAITQIRSNINSSYNALVLQFKRSSRRGLGFRITYTWSHSLDDGQTSTVFVSSNRNNVLSPVAPFTYQLCTSNCTNPLTIAASPRYTLRHPAYGNSRNDIRQRLTVALYWSPHPFRYSHGFLHQALRHWTISPIVHLSSGRPFTARVRGYSPLYTCSGCYGYLGTGGPDWLPFLGRNSFRYGTLFNTDLRLSRKIRFGHGRRDIELLAEVFNLFNHPIVRHRSSTIYTTYNSSSGISYLQYNSSFRTPAIAANSFYYQRRIQLALRVHF